MLEIVSETVFLNDWECLRRDGGTYTTLEVKVAKLPKNERIVIVLNVLVELFLYEYKSTHADQQLILSRGQETHCVKE